ncbi:MAG: hypothetical protein GY849_17500 [Deltaproteobacteria bacterium]|nr:hypothetical protein [Deltaproteobacteria bacterium]
MTEIKTLETLNYFLENLQEETEELEQKIKVMKQSADFSNWKWLKHKVIEKNDYRKKLPCPRIEMRIFGDRYCCGWSTGIVYPAYQEKNHYLFVPLTETTTTGTDILQNNNPHLPFRDETHIYSYSRIFNLRMFITRDKDKFIKELYVKDSFLFKLEEHEKNNCRI